MNLDTAIAAHAEWKIKLRSAISAGETLDAKAITADNCCALGKWLHGDARRLLGGSPAYADCVSKHATFHREAGRIAEMINAKQMSQASAMLESGTPYAAASSAVGVALNRLKRDMSASAAP